MAGKELTPTPTVELVHFSASRAGAWRIEQLEGRDHYVFPAVMVQEQVLDNNLGKGLLPGEEITDSWAIAWNGAPVVITHPTRSGVNISARDPVILNTTGVGRVFNCHVEEKDGSPQLKADVYIAVDREEAVADLKDVIANLKAGKAVELSTGFPTGLEVKSGEFKGREYNSVFRPIGADHLAIIVEGKGACSVAHGCGLGVNQDAGAIVETLETALATNCDGTKPPKWLATFMRAINGAGARNTREALKIMAENAEPPSDDEKRTAVQNALVEKYGGVGKDVWVIATYSDQGVVVFMVWSEITGTTLYQVGYTVSDAGVVEFSGTPEQVIERVIYEPVSGQAVNSNQESSMDRKAVIATLAAAGPLTTATLEKLDDTELEALQKLPKPVAANAEEVKQEAAAPAAPEGMSKEQAADILNKLGEIGASVSGLTTKVGEQSAELANLREVAQPAIEEQAAEKAALVGALASNSAAEGFTKEELEGKPLSELRRLAVFAGKARQQPANFVLRAQPRIATNAADEPQYAAPVPYYQKQDSTGKEA